MNGWNVTTDGSNVTVNGWNISKKDASKYIVSKRHWLLANNFVCFLMSIILFVSLKLKYNFNPYFSIYFWLTFLLLPEFFFFFKFTISYTVSYASEGDRTGSCSLFIHIPFSSLLFLSFVRFLLLMLMVFFHSCSFFLFLYIHFFYFSFSLPTSLPPFLLFRFSYFSLILFSSAVFFVSYQLSFPLSLSFFFVLSSLPPSCFISNKQRDRQKKQI